MSLINIVKSLQATHNRYFKLLIDTYPTLQKQGPAADFGRSEQCELAIEAHACAIALGRTAWERLAYIGFDVLYPFDNPVDQYNWRVAVRNNRIDHAIYASVAVRVDAELKRLRRTIELGGEAAYNELPADALLVSKDRYAALSHTPTGNGTPPREPQPPQINIQTVHLTNAPDSQAVSRLEELETRTSIWSNVSNIATLLKGLF